ncbi:MAG: winged helix-turn-helix domain-containing protein [Candidatus Bathyarchaeia archaeon]
MPLSTFDPLGNPRTSQVLFQIIRGVDTPTNIAKELQVKPPAVIDQLYKLRKIRVVKLGDKTGKEQHYAIDWTGLAEESIRRTVSSHYYTKPVKKFKTSDIRWIDEVVSSQAQAYTEFSDFIKKLPEFQLFLRTYFETLLSYYYKGDDYAKQGMQLNPTFTHWLNSMYETLVSMMEGDHIGPLRIDEQSLPFSDMLRQWVSMRPQLVDPYAGTYLLDALSKLGFKS